MIKPRIAIGLVALWSVAAAQDMPEKAERYRTMLMKKPENGVLFGRMLDAWLEERDLAGLKAELERRAEEGNAVDWRVLAAFHEHAGSEDEALKALDKAVGLAPDDAAARLARGKAMGAALRFDDALADLEAAAKDPKLALEAGTLRGKLLARAGRPAEAVKAWQELIAAHPEDEGLKEDLIELEIGEGMLDEAVVAARALAEGTADPYQKALRRLRVAEILAQAGKKEDALEEYREVFAVSAESSWLEREVLARTGDLFTREDDITGLGDFLKELREAYPRRVAVKKEAAKAMLASGDEDEAVAMFREVLKVLPGDMEVREEFVALLEGAGRAKDAAAELEAMIAAGADDGARWERLAGLKKLAGDADGAKQAQDKALSLLAADEQGMVAKARLLERFERIDEAEKSLREAVAAHGSGGEAGEALAGFLVVHEKTDEALALWKEMAAKADREGLLRIVRSMSAHGKAPDAFAMLKPRMEEFGGDPLVLSAFCQAALLSDDAGTAVPHAIRLLRLAGAPTDFETAMRLATGLISRGGDARKWIDELSALPEPSIQERCLLAEIHESVGDSIAAENLLKDAMAGEDALIAAAQRVRLLEMRGAFEPAVDAQRELMALPGGRKPAQAKRLVELIEKTGDFESALEETAAWLKLAPGDKLAWAKRADLFLDDARPEEAVAELRRAVAKFGSDEDLRAKLASAQVEAGLTEEAWRSFFAMYDEGESAGGKLKWVRELARLAATEGREDELMKEFRRRARENTTSVLSLLALAEIFSEWNMGDEELECLSDASRRRPDDAKLKFRIADLHEEVGNIESASAMLRSLAGGPEAREARRRLAGLWIRGGETERGLRELISIEEGGDPRNTEKVAASLIQAKEWDMAADFLTRETKSHPDDWRLAYLRGVCLVENDRPDEAVPVFAALLEAEGEIDGLAPLMNNSYYHPSMRRRAEKPEVSRESVQMMQQYRQRAMAHRNANNYWGGQAPGMVQLPGTPDEARRISLAQLVELGSSDDELRARIEPLLVSSHFDDMDVLRAGAFLKRTEVEDLVLSDKATPEILRWWIRTGGMHQSRRNADKIVPKAMELLKDEDPELTLSFLSWTPRGGLGAAAPETAPLVLELYGKLDDKKRVSFLHVVQTVMLDNPELPDELSKQAETIYHEELKKLSGEPQYAWSVITMVGKLLSADRIDEAFEWLNRLEEELEKMADSGNRFRNRYSPYYGSQGNQTESPNFETRLQQAEPNVWEWVGPRRNARSQANEAQLKLLEILGENANFGPSAPPRVDVKKAAESAGKLTNRMKRICFLHAAEREDDVKREIEAIEKDPEASASDLYIAAAWWSEKEPARAYQITRRAMKAPKASEFRDQLDTDLMELGLQLSGEENIDLEPARRAALRKRSSFSANPEMKGQLAAKLTKLGMADEAARLLKAPAATSIAMRRSQGRRSSFGMSNDINAKISELMRDKRADAAARRLFVELRNASRSQNADHQRERVLELAKSFKLEDKMLEIAKPAEGAGSARKREYALLLIALDRKTDALPILRTLAEEMPDDPAVRTGLLVALPEEERNQALESLAGGAFDADLASSMFLSAFQADDPDKRMVAADAVARFLAVLEPDFGGDRNLSWVNYSVNGFVAENHVGDIRFRALMEDSGEERDVDEERSERRFEICKRLLPAMLRHPQTSDQGFIMLHLCRKALGVSDEELDRAAATAMRLGFRLESPDQNSPNYHYRGRQSLWYRIRNGGAWGRGEPKGQILPEEYIAARAREGVKIDPFDDGFIAELESHDEESAAMVKRCRAIATATDPAAFGKWFEKARTDMRAVSRDLKLIFLLAQRGERADLEESIENAVAEAMLEDGVDTTPLVEILASQVKGQDSPEAKFAALERMARHILGPEEAWPLYGELGSSYYGSTYNRLNRFRSMIQQFQGDPSAELVALRFSFARRVPMEGYGSTNGIENALRGARTEEDFERIGIFTLGPEMVAESKNSTVPAQMVIQSLRNGDEKKTAKVLLKMEGDGRFWARVIGGIMGGDQDAVRAELAKNTETIAAWPVVSRAELARFLETSGVGPKPGTALAKLFAESRKKDLAQIRKDAADFLENGSPEDLHPYSPEPVATMISTLAEADPDLAVQVWSRCLEDFEKRQRGGMSSSNGFPTHMNDYATNELTERMCRDGMPVKAYVGFVARFAESAQGRLAGIYDGNSEYYLRQLIEKEMTLRRDEFIKASPLKEGGDDLRSFTGMCMTYLKKFDEKERAGLTVALPSFVLQGGGLRSGKAPEMMLDWVSKSLRPKDPALADVLELTIFSMNSRRDGKEIDTRFRKACSGFLARKNVPGPLRIRTISMLQRRTSSFSDIFRDPLCAAAAADLYLEFITPERRWASDVTVGFLHAIAALSELPADKARALMERMETSVPATAAASVEASAQMASLRVALALRCDDASILAREVRAGGLGRRLDLSLHLWRASHPEEAVRLLARPGEFHDGLNQLFARSGDERIRYPKFSKEIESALPGWLESIDDAEQRYRIECLVSSLADAEGDDAPSLARPARLEKLAGRFANEAAKAKTARMEVLTALTSEHDAAVALEEDVAKATRGRGMDEIVISGIAGQRGARLLDENESCVLRLLVKRKCMLALARGDGAPFLKEVTGVTDHMLGDGRWVGRSTLSTLMNEVTPRLVRAMVESEADKKKELGTVSLKVSGALLGQEDNDFHRVGAALAMVAPALAGDGAAYDLWLEALDPVSRERYDRIRKSYGTARLMSSLTENGLKEEKYNDVRRRILVGFLSDPITYKREVPHPTYLSELMDGGAFTRDDVLAAVDLLPEDQPQLARLIAEKAGIIGWRVRDEKTALEAYAKAEEIATAAGNERDLAYVCAYKAGYLNEHTKRKDEAVTIAEAIDPELLDERERGWRDNVLKSKKK